MYHQINNITIPTSVVQYSTDIQMKPYEQKDTNSEAFDVIELFKQYLCDAIKDSKETKSYLKNKYPELFSLYDKG